MMLPVQKIMSLTGRSGVLGMRLQGILLNPTILRRPAFVAMIAEGTFDSGSFKPKPTFLKY